MEDDDDVSPDASPSPASSTGAPSAALPVAEPVTVAAAPPGGAMAVALPIHRTAASLYATAGGGGGGGGGGREDAWSEGATSALIDAWGERFVALGRGSLRHPQWQEVADAVSSRDGYSKAPKSDVQCKNRIDTLKKKYKVERAKRGSSWPYFDRLDDLLAPVYKQNSSSSSAAARNAVPMVPPRINFPQRTRTPLQPSAGAKRRMPSPPPQASASSDSSDGFPPGPPSAVALANGKRQRVGESTAATATVANGAESSGGRAQGLRDLALAIRRLGEVYERVESAKRDQELRMERERLDAARELEDQRVQFFLKMQMELSKATGGAAIAIPADGNGMRREGMAAEVAASSNHRVRYRIKGSRHHHAPQQPHYQNNEAPAGGNGSDSDNKEAEENAEGDEEEESQ